MKIGKYFITGLVALTAVSTWLLMTEKLVWSSSFQERSEKKTSEIHPVVKISSELGFPFELQTEILRSESSTSDKKNWWTARIFLEERFVSKENLDQLFSWFSNRHDDKKYGLDVWVHIERLLQEDMCPPGSDCGPEPSADFDPNKIKLNDYVAWYKRKPDGRSGGIWSESYFYTTKGKYEKERHTVVMRGHSFSVVDSEVVERKEFVKGKLKIRVDRELADAEPTGDYYHFWAIHSEKADDTLTFITTFLKNGETKISLDAIRLISDKIAYGWIGWKYFVTQNGGKEWDIWDAEVSLQSFKCCDDNLILNVTVSSVGTGEMLLRNQGGEAPIKLVTTDFGKTWK
jgi:hypothetical protein